MISKKKILMHIFLFNRSSLVIQATLIRHSKNEYSICKTYELIQSFRQKQKTMADFLVSTKVMSAITGSYFGIKIHTIQAIITQEFVQIISCEARQDSNQSKILCQPDHS